MDSYLSASPPFHPTEEAADDILAAYADPDQTLTEIARRFKVSIRALAAWLNSPETLRHIEELQQVTARRIKHIAVANERLALNLLISVIEGHLDAEANIPVNTQSLKAVAQRDRARATARLAASQLIRLAHGPGGTGVPPVLSAQGPHDTGTRPRRTPTAHISQSQAGRLCHQDRQTAEPPNPDPSPTPAPSTHNIESTSPAHSPTPEPDTHAPTGRQAAPPTRATQAILRAPQCDFGFRSAAGENETG